MGIYIPKEFPKNCNDCPCTIGWNCFADNEMRDIAEYDDNHTKPDWCPLIEVPPHGRLIDADALEDSLDSSEEDGYCRYMLWDAPTIIEAESET